MGFLADAGLREIMALYKRGEGLTNVVCTRGVMVMKRTKLRLINDSFVERSFLQSELSVNRCISTAILEQIKYRPVALIYKQIQEA